MTELCEGSRDHLLEALRSSDPAEKNYHIRQVLQAAIKNPDEADVELDPISPN